MDSLRHAARRPVAEVSDEVLVDAAGSSDTEAAVLEQLTTERAEPADRRTAPGAGRGGHAARGRRPGRPTAGEILGKWAAAVRVSTHRGLRRLAVQLRAARAAGGAGGTGGTDDTDGTAAPTVSG